MNFLVCGFVQDKLFMAIFSFKLEHEKRPVLILYWDAYGQLLQFCDISCNSTPSRPLTGHTIDFPGAINLLMLVDKREKQILGELCLSHNASCRQRLFRAGQK